MGGWRGVTMANHDWCPDFKKKELWTQTCTWGCHVKKAAEIQVIQVTRLQAKEQQSFCWKTPEARREGKEQTLPQGPQEEVTMPTPRSWNPGLQN